jgi:hypothetical protein
MTEADSENPIAWRAVRYGTPMVSADGQAVGVIREVLGSDAEDIFHGLRVQLNHSHRDVLVPATEVIALTVGRIETDLSIAALEALPAYTEETTFHLASVGWLRKHLGWKRDNQSDEEPG